MDGNGNGDLTDDAMFEEGEDFVGAQPFAAGLMGRNDALWLTRPVRLDRSGETPRAVAVPERIEATNRMYLKGEVEIPTTREDGEMPDVQLLLFDTDSDGDYGDSEGAMGVWAMENETDGLWRPLALLPMNETASFGGYLWRLERGSSGARRLRGTRQTPIAPVATGTLRQRGPNWPS